MRLVERKRQDGAASKNSNWIWWGASAVGLALTIVVSGQATRPGAASRPATAQVVEKPDGALELKQMSLEQLLNLEVTSVSRRESTLLQSPAAVFVITQDDIRRSGAKSIAEALRMAPGMDVARIDNSTYAISARGFNSNSANKLLVQIDGRSVYTPLFSGVFWDVQDTFMEDIDRIEVIRGPAGAVWGANAVNGIVNVITKSAEETQGLLIVGGGGTQERAFAGARYGFRINEDTFARVYMKGFKRNELELPDGGGAGDKFQMGQGGFRVDGHPSHDNRYTVQGDIYAGERSQASPTIPDETELAGGNILGRWTHTLAGKGGEVTLQMYFDRTQREIPETFKEKRNTFDLDFQHHFPLGGNQDITWGLGFRVTHDDVGNSATIAFIPDHRTSLVYSAFVQDEIQLIPKKLTLTIGSKFEYNDYFTGFEFQPSARLLWTIDERQAAWAAISRAVRTPTRLEDDLRITTGPFVVTGNRDFDSETVIAYELGYRVNPTKWLNLDVAAFYNDYDKLLSLETTAPTTFFLDNQLNGRTYGFELSSTIQVADWWTIRAAYWYLQEILHTDGGSTDTTSRAAAGNNPHNQAYIRSSMNLARNVQFDVFARYVDRLKTNNVPAYVAVDMRLAWQVTPQMELSIVGQNLFDDRHPEFGADNANRHEIPRGVYAQIALKL